MGWLSSIFGVAKPEAAPPEVSPARKRGAAEHVERFERAVLQCEQAVQRGEATSARLAELHKWLGYYRQIEELERGVR